MMQSVKAKAFNILLIRFVKIGQSILTFFIMASILGKEDFGYYAFNYAIALSMIVLSYFGSEQYGLKALTKSKLFIGRLLVLKFLFSLVFSVLYLLISKLLTPDVRSFYVLLVVVHILFNFELLIFNYLNSMNRLDLLARNILISFFLSSIIKLYSLWLDDLDYLYIAIALDAIIPFLLFCYVSFGFGHLSLNDKVLSKFSLFFKRHRKKLFFLFLATILVQINIRLDSYFVSVYLGGSQLSSYSIALKFNEVFAVLISSTIALYSPRFFRAVNSHELSVIARKIMLITLILYFFSMLIVFSLYGLINDYLLSGLYSEARNVIFILFSGTLFGGFSSIISMWYIYNGRESSKTKRVFCSLLINIILSMLLIPALGMIGAAIVSLIINFTLAIVLNLNAKAFREFSYEIICKKNS